MKKDGMERLTKYERIEFLITNYSVDFSKDYFAQTEYILCEIGKYIKVDNYRYRNPNYTLRQTYYYSLQRFYYTNKEYFDSLAK